MISMTGFGYREYQDDNVHITLEIKTLNNRYLDLIVNLPGSLGVLEPRIRTALQDRFRRGRVECHIRVRELAEDLLVRVDEEAARAYADALRTLSDAAGVTDETRLEHLLGLEGVLKTERRRDPEALWERIAPLLEEAATDVRTDRQKEGDRLEQDIREQIALLSACTAEVEARAPEMETKITDTLRERFREVLGDEAEERRILAETAAYLVRYDINEEIVRLKSHFASFDEIAADGEPAGKRLDFLCQELGREVNTIGSKSTLVEINRTVVTMKDALEKIREQLRNVE